MANVAVEKSETRYVLELSEDEADALVAVLGRVGGVRDNSPRKHTEAVYAALAEHVGRSIDTHANKLLGHGNVWFSDYDDDDAKRVLNWSHLLDNPYRGRDRDW